MKLDLEQAAVERFNPMAVEDLFRELEFRTLTQQLRTLVQKLNPSHQTEQAVQTSLFGNEPANPLVTPKDDAGRNNDIQTVIVDTPEKLTSAAAELRQYKRLAFDTETTSTDALRCNLVGLSLAGSEDKGFYFPVGHAHGEQLSLAEVKKPCSHSWMTQKSRRSPTMPNLI